MTKQLIFENYGSCRNSGLTLAQIHATVDRKKIIAELIDAKEYKNYLEIGVFNGHVFFKVKARFKVAVDPCFRFTTSRKIIKNILNWHNFHNLYFEKTSDEFFATDAATVFKNRKIDICLIDGLHEYKYALNDAESLILAIRRWRNHYA